MSQSSCMAFTSTSGNFASVFLRGPLMRAGKAMLVRGLPWGPPAVDVAILMKPVLTLSFACRHFPVGGVGAVRLRDGLEVWSSFVETFLGP